MSRLLLVLVLLGAEAALAPSATGLPTLSAPLEPGLAALLRAKASEPPPGVTHGALGSGGLAASGASTLYDNGPQGLYDLERLDLDVFVKPGENDLTVFSTLTLTSLQEGLDKIELAYLLPPVLWVRLPDDTPLENTPTGSGLFTVVPDHLLAKGESWTFRMAATGSIDCSGSMVAACEFAEPITYLTHAGYFPRNVNASDPVVGTLRLAVPPEYSAAATGTLVSITDEGGARVFTWDHTVPTDFFSFGVAPYQVVADDPSGFPITVWSLPEHQSGAADMIPIADQVLALYGQRYAPYPWSKLDVVEIGNSFGGGYGPLSSIFMLSWVFQMPADHPAGAFVSELVSHELGHQWWGNLVSIWSPDSIWLSEGFAEFSSCLFDEVTEGRRGQFVRNGLIYQYQVPQAADKPITHYQVYMSEYYQPIMYQKGSFILDMLRFELGDDTFFAAMQHFVANFGYAFAHVSDFAAAVEESSGQDLGWFWDQWLYGHGHPGFVVSATRTTEGVTLRLEQTQTEQTFTMRLPVRVLTAGAEAQLSSVSVDGASVEADVSFTGEPLLVSIDPDRRQLRRLALANPADANLDGSVNGLDVIRFASGMQRNLVHGTDQGDYFYPNANYPDFLDLAFDGKVDQADWELFAAAFVGAEL
jgi:hypothetical protein